MNSNSARYGKVHAECVSPKEALQKLLGNKTDLVTTTSDTSMETFLKKEDPKKAESEEVQS